MQWIKENRDEDEVVIGNFYLTQQNGGPGIVGQIGVTRDEKDDIVLVIHYRYNINLKNHEVNHEVRQWKVKDVLWWAGVDLEPVTRVHQIYLAASLLAARWISEQSVVNTTITLFQTPEVYKTLESLIQEEVEIV